MFPLLDIPICKRCKDLPKYEVVNKTKSKEMFRVTDDDLAQLSSYKKRTGWGSYCILYLKQDVEDMALKRWGSTDNLEAELERVEKERKVRQERMDKMREGRREELGEALKRMYGIDIADVDEGIPAYHSYYYKRGKFRYYKDMVVYGGASIPVEHVLNHLHVLKLTDGNHQAAEMVADLHLLHKQTPFEILLDANEDLFDLCQTIELHRARMEGYANEDIDVEECEDRADCLQNQVIAQIAREIAQGPSKFTPRDDSNQDGFYDCDFRTYKQLDNKSTRLITDHSN